MHTPGPWEAEKLGYSGFRVTYGHEKERCRYLCHGYEEKNASILAAAPDMLEALHEALKVMQLAEKYFPKSIQNSDTFTLLNVEENSIRKAIRKAEGGLK